MDIKKNLTDIYLFSYIYVDLFLFVNDFRSVDSKTGGGGRQFFGRSTIFIIFRPVQYTYIRQQYLYTYSTLRLQHLPADHCSQIQRDHKYLVSEVFSYTQMNTYHHKKKLTNTKFNIYLWSGGKTQDLFIIVFIKIYFNF